MSEDLNQVALETRRALSFALDEIDRLRSALIDHEVGRHLDSAADDLDDKFGVEWMRIGRPELEALRAELDYDGEDVDRLTEWEVVEFAVDDLRHLRSELTNARRRR